MAARTIDLTCMSDSASSTSNFASWPRTPPSVVAIESYDASNYHSHVVSRSLRECAMLQEQSRSDTPVMPLRIRVRNTRVLLFASTFLALLSVLVALFARGVGLVTLEGTRTEKEQRALIDYYSFYSGTTASLVAKPFEICVSAMLPVMYLVFATKLCLHDDSFKSTVAMLLLQALLATTLTSAFSSLYVQQRPPQISPIVVDVDLASRNSVSRRETQAQVPVDPFQRRATTDTVLSTAMQPAFVKSEKNPCAVNGEWRHVAAAHAFPSSSWLKDLLPHGVEPSASLQLTVGDLVLSKSSKASARPPANQTLPYDMMTATNLLLYLMFTSETLMPWIPSAGMENSTFDQFLVRAAQLNTSNDYNGFLRAAAKMINESVHRQAKWLNYSASETTLNFSRIELSDDIVFDAVTIDIPFQEQLMVRSMYVDEKQGGLKYGNDPNKPTPKNAMAVYDVATALDCGVDACLVSDPIATVELLKRTNKRSPEPQIQAFAPCDFGNGSEDVTVAYLHNQACRQRLNSSMLVYSIGKRIVADEMILDPPGKVLKERIGHLVNVRPFHTITMGWLRWKTHDIAERFNAVCDVQHTSSGCYGLSFPLEGNASQVLVVGEKHLPLSALGPFMGIRSQWMPLVTVSSTRKDGDLLFTRNAKRVVNWTMDVSCSDSIETLARQVDANRWYIEHGLQEAYTAALFFLFQDAALREVRTRVDKKPTLDFVGSRIQVTLEAKIPLLSALASLSGSALLLLAVVLVVLVGKRTERSIRDRLDAHRVAKVLLVEQSFPKFFLECTVADPRRSAISPQPLERFRIESLSLKPLYAHPVSGSATAVHHSAVIRLPPQSS